MGGLPLVASKLAAPLTPDSFLLRERLHQHLDGALETALTVVVGAAGSGKSALVAEWSQRKGDRIRRVWVNVDEGDTPERLLRHVATALTGHEVATGRERDTVLAAIRRSSDQRPLVIVFDDLHQARSRQLVYELAALVEDGPPNLHVVLIARADPCFGPAGRSARSQPLELRNEDLRLTDVEVEQIVEAHPCAHLEREALDELTRKVDGWAAGLQLALASLAHSADPAATISRFGATTPAVADYLLHEVLSQLPPAHRAFMVDIAALDNLSLDACRFLTGRDDAAEVLADLARDNLLIEPYSDESYRYHPLLQQLLRLRLEQSDPARARRLHQFAADYGMRTGDVLGAIGHLIEAEDHGAAISVCVDHIDELTALGGSSLVLRWLGRIPELLSSSVDVQLDAAWLALRAGDVVGCARRIERCRVHSGASATVAVRWRMAALRSHCHHRLGEPEAALADTELARHLGAGAAWADGESLTVPRAFGLLWTGMIEPARQELPVGVGGPNRRPVEAGLRARIELQAGDVEATERLVRQALAAADRLGLAAVHPDRLHALAADAELLVEQLAPTDVTTEAVERLLAIGSLHDSRDHLVVGLCLQARLRWSETCTESALGSLASGRALQRSRPLSPALQTAIDALDARLLVELGEGERAHLVIERLDGGVRDRLRARALAQAGSIGEALAVLDRAVTRTVSTTHAFQLTRARVLADAEDPAAFDAVAELLDGALANRFRRSYLEEGPAFLKVLRAVDHPLARPIVEALDRAAGHASATTLSDRELAVLQFLPTRLTNQEIGDQLYVSLNTVKTHLKSLYRRLGVRSRDDAVSRARQLGLLASDADRPSSASALAGLVTRLNITGLDDAGVQREQHQPERVDPLDQPLDVVDDSRELSRAR